MCREFHFLSSTMNALRMEGKPQTLPGTTNGGPLSTFAGSGGYFSYLFFQSGPLALSRKNGGEREAMDPDAPVEAACASSWQLRTMTSRF